MKSRLGLAFNYTLGQWPRLVNYLDDGIIKMDNNQAENSIRPFVVGRKNWLFFEQPGGAEAGAILYSLIESTKANGLEPYKYFCYIFDKLPGIDGDDDQHSPRLSEERFYDFARKTEGLKISEVTEFKVAESYWNEIERSGKEERQYFPVWPDENRANKKYPHRFLFNQKSIQSVKDILFGKLSRDTIEILKRVMISPPEEVEFPQFRKIEESFSRAKENI